MYDYDLKGAHADFEKAITIEPGYATAHQWHGELLAVEGNLDAALDELRLARQADPLAAIIPHVMGWFLSETDRKEEAFAYYKEALELSPHRPGTIGNLLTLNLMTGRFEQARTNSRELMNAPGYDPATNLAVIDAVENPALKSKALAQLARDTILPDGVAGKATYFMLLNEPGLALDSLEKSFAAGAPYAIHMKRMDVFEPLHDNPRFQVLLAKINLWP